MTHNSTPYTTPIEELTLSSSSNGTTKTSTSSNTWWLTRTLHPLTVSLQLKKKRTRSLVQSWAKMKTSKLKTQSLITE